MTRIAKQKKQVNIENIRRQRNDISFLNLFADILVVGVCIVFAMFVGWESIAGKVSIIFVCGIFFCAVIYYLLLPGNLPCQLKIPAEGWKNKTMTGYLQIEHTRRIPIFYGKAACRIRNLLTEEEIPFTITIAMMGKGHGLAPFAICSETMGILEVSISKIQVYGLFGTFSKTDRPYLTQEIMILPDTKEIHMDLKNPAYYPTEGENVLPSRKGYDTSLYQGVRPYEEGDSLKHIHWKMTGKTEEYMVKELGQPAAPVPVIFLETVLADKSAVAVDALLERYISFSQFLVEKGMTHFLCWKDEDS
ncbi:MAG: DUF58 domain-containing protein, partial [Clostridiales bacterium]|nr:DUF58 domain-containing protein [Clostridiales bacterium]